MADDVVVKRAADELEAWHKNPLERAGWRKQQLLRQLALGEITQKRLGEMYGVSQAAISRFGTRHAADIEMIRNQLAEKAMNGMEHLWISQKVNRVAEYQDIAEKMAEINTARSNEIRIQALKSTAEELGDLPARMQVNVSSEQTVYEVIGISVEDL